jgi:hypothetical protein
VRIQVVLDLRWVDILPASDDDILFSSDDVQVPLVVDGRYVARVEPALLIEYFGRQLGAW